MDQILPINWKKVEKLSKKKIAQFSEYYGPMKCCCGNCPTDPSILAQFEDYAQVNLWVVLCGYADR